MRDALYDTLNVKRIEPHSNVELHIHNIHTYLLRTLSVNMRILSRNMHALYIRRPKWVVRW